MLVARKSQKCPTVQQPEAIKNPEGNISRIPNHKRDTAKKRKILQKLALRAKIFFFNIGQWVEQCLGVGEKKYMEFNLTQQLLPAFSVISLCAVVCSCLLVAPCHCKEQLMLSCCNVHPIVCLWTPTSETWFLGSFCNVDKLFFLKKNQLFSKKFCTEFFLLKNFHFLVVPCYMSLCNVVQLSVHPWQDPLPPTPGNVISGQLGQF